MRVFQRILLFLLILNAALVTAKPAILSKEAKISLLSCSPGYELYSVFGHSALRVFDPNLGIDSVYNYGTFDFETEDFYLKFSRGKLDYMLSRQYFPQFQYAYIVENRSIHEAELLLNWDQKQTLYELLEENYLPENRFYRYDFFHDNCATRIRDIVREALGEGLDFHCKESSGLSYRNQVEKYTRYLPWSLFGISLALGAPYDLEMKGEEIMFLPDELEMAFLNATYRGSALTAERTEILNRENVSVKPGVFNPGLLGLLFLAFMILLILFERKRGKTFLVIRGGVMVLVGLIGMLVFLLWVATDHVATKPNWDVIWLLPLNLLFVFALRARLSRLFKVFLLVASAGVLLALALSLIGIFPSYYWSYESAILLFYLSFLPGQGVFSKPN